MSTYPKTAEQEPAPAPLQYRPRRRALTIGLALAFATGASSSDVIARENGPESFLPATPRDFIPVSNCNDSGPGSLREAMTTAMDGDFVDAQALICSTITLTTGQINVGASSVTLAGPGAGALTIANGGDIKYYGRIFSHRGTGTLVVAGVTLADGVAAGSVNAPDALGGCIYSDGTVLLSNSVVKNCSAFAGHDANGNPGAAGGGGIFAHTVLLTGSTVSGCSVSSVLAFANGGGGILATDVFRVYSSELRDNHETGTKYGGGGAFVGGLLAISGPPYTSIVDSTIAGNTAANGGGLSLAGNVWIRNSTISGNMAAQYGGGLVAGHACDGLWLRISNSTITDNRSDAAGEGGVHLEGCPDLQSTLIAGNVPNDVVGPAQISGANNFVGFSTPVTPALPPGTIVGADPRLGPLANNGGPTRTHALLVGSAAIDRGNNAAGIGYDQRGSGHPRTVGAAPDIGAYEFQDRIFQDGFD